MTDTDTDTTTTARYRCEDCKATIEHASTAAVISGNCPACPSGTLSTFWRVDEVSGRD